MNMFEIHDTFIEAKSLHEVCETEVPRLYLDDLGKLSSEAIVENYLNTTDLVSGKDTSLDHKAVLDTFIPPSSPSDFSISRTTINGCLQPYGLDGCSNIHIGLTKNSSIVQSSLLDESSSSAIFSPFFNSSFNLILYVANLSNFNLPFLLLSGGYLVRSGDNSSPGGAVASSQPTDGSTNKTQFASQTTGTALGHGVGEDGDGDDPRNPRNFNQLKMEHYRNLTEEEFRELLLRIFRNQIENMSESEVINLVTAFAIHTNCKDWYHVSRGRFTLYKDNSQADYLFLVNAADAKRPQFFIKTDNSRTDDYNKECDPHIQSLIRSAVNKDVRNNSSLLSNRTTISSLASTNRSERSSRRAVSQNVHLDLNASTRAVAEAQADQAQNQEQEQAQLQTQEQTNSPLSLQTLLALLLGTAGVFAFNQGFSIYVPGRRNKEKQLRAQGQNRGRQDFADDVVQSNEARLFGGLGRRRIPMPTLENEAFSLPLEDENSASFKAGQAEGYSLQQRDHQREYPKHKAKINEISRASRRSNQAQFNPGNGFSINAAGVLGMLMELGSVLLFRRRNRKKNKKKDQ